MFHYHLCMANWIDELNENIATEFAGKPAVVTLATVRSDGVPDARNVVVRKISDEGQLLITSDSRSQKNRQITLNPLATIVLWLPTQRKQYRIDGKIDILAVDDPLRLQMWHNSSDSARALFFWPPAGEPRSSGDFPKLVKSDQPMPESFEVLRLTPEHVDVLDLNPHPHHRVRWTLTGQTWMDLPINP